MRAELAAALSGAGVVALLLTGRMVLVPDPPARASVPRVESLEALSAFLAADTTRPGAADRGPTVRLARDPFGATGRAEETRSAEPRERAGPEWSVSAIMIADARRIAIVDDRLVEAGDMLSGGARVLSIARDHVLIAGPDGVRRRVALNQ